jgi:hypothetical protein
VAISGGKKEGNSSMIRAFRFLNGTIALMGLALQFWLMANYPNRRGIAVTIMNFVSYFTILTNILIVLCMLVPLVAPESRASRFLSRPSVRTAVVSYSAVIGIIYFVFLRNIGHDRGLERLADQLLHYVTPTMFIIDWLTFVPKGHVAWRSITSFLIFPALYGIWTLIHGAVTGWYPYPFLNAKKIGYSEMLGSFVALTCVLVAVPLAFVALDHLLSPLRRERNPT